MHLSRLTLSLLAAGSAAATLLALAGPLPAQAAAPGGSAAAPRASVRVVPASLAATPSLGYDRIGVRRSDSWYLRDALDGGDARSYREGTGGWQPVAGDTDGDGDGTLSLFRDGLWLIRDSEQQSVPRVVQFGLRGDVPVLGDWDGDGVDTIGVFRAGRWYLRNSNTGGPSTPFSFGSPGDVPVVGDWNGDGRTGIGLYRGRRFYERDVAAAGLSSRNFDFGVRGDLPVSGDWDHDGIDTPGVFRDGSWYLRTTSAASSTYQTVRFGQRGDRPVVRRAAQLAPGVTHQVVGDPSAPWLAHVATVDLQAVSSPDPVLALGGLAGIERVSSMSRRVGAVLGVNGDFFLGSGRPVHLFAQDGELVQTPTTLGRAFSLDQAGTTFSMGYPDVRATVTATVATGTATLRLDRVNNGRSDSADASGFTAAGAMLETPADGDCYAGLAPAGAATVGADGLLRTPMSVTGTRCGGSRPIVPSTGLMLSTDPFYAGSSFVRALARDQAVTLTTQLGFPGAVDAMGGNPLLVKDGAVLDAQVDQTDAFYARNPRTAVGVTSDGKMLIVVVDGRSSRSRGMTMRELAELMQTLGAKDALNLDGGGSSAMFLNGLLVSRPSDGYERGVGNALVVLPGADVPQAAGVRTATAPRNSLYLPGARDAGSTGGLADALVRQGVPMTDELRRTAGVFAGH